MADASSLHCPNCGASAEPDARRCPYCKARLATVSCPSCFALMFDGAAFCPKCGARRVREEQETADVRCPGCSRQLQQVTLGDTPMLECTACDGVWVDADVFERIVSDREAQAAVLHRFPRASQARVGRVRYRKCVRCGTIMNRMNFGRISGTVVDVCRGHGTYLDAGELHEIVQFIHSGGLERARERKLEEMREQERRLREIENRVAMTRGQADPHAAIGLRWDGSSVLELLKHLTDRLPR